MKKRREKNDKKHEKTPLDYYFGKPRIEISGSECLIDGLDSIIEYSNDKIQVSVGNRLVTFHGSKLKINSFTHEGAIVEGDIMSIAFSQYYSVL